METISVTENAKEVITALCNKATTVEYDMLLGYPRLIDHIINFEKIKDKQLVDDITRLGKESLGHYQKTDYLITRLGGQVDWKASPLPRLVDIETELERQLEKEYFARDTYREVRRVAMGSKCIIRSREFFGRTFQVYSDVREDAITSDEIVSIMDRLIMDEERHARMAQDCIATFGALKKRPLFK